MKWTYFTDSETEGLQDEFVAKLEKAREVAGVPFVITSGYRSPEKNQSLPNAVSDSAHLTGHAVDLLVAESGVRFTIIKALLDTGFNRLGIYASHIHVDDDDTKPSNVIWYVAAD